MVIRQDLPEGETFRRGMGPRCLYAFAGGGRGLTYEGAAGDFWVHFSLCTVARLRLLSYLCANGPTRPPKAASALGIHYNTVLIALNGMKDCRLVASRPSAIVTPVSRARKGGVYALDWDATEDGRKYLWRYAWVTGKLSPGLWSEDTWNGQTDTPPWEALAQYAQPSLLRPAHLAIAYWMRDTQPIEKFRLANLLGLPVSTVHHAIQRWAALGWVETREPRPALIGGRFPTGGRAAVRWAGQNSGYAPPDDDPFLNHTFGPDWVEMTFE
jgi:hypothetical protein